MKSSTITINGREYDAITGMPVLRSKTAPMQPIQAQNISASTPTTKPKATPRPQPKPAMHRAFSDIAPATKQPKPTATPAIKRTAHSVHQKPQKSHTLHRSALKKPAQAAIPTPKPTRSPAISKFGSLGQPQPVTVPVQPETEEQPAQPQIHPTALQAIANTKQMQNAQALPVALPQDSKELKEQLIKERLAEVKNTVPASEQKKTGFFAKRPRLAAVMTSTLAILLLGGYLTYINLPNISMRVAATRAGVAANFPGYHPDGYSLSGPITYSPGEVTINFKSNSDSRNGFSIVQKTSNWDSQAVLENYVNKQTQSPTTQQEGGLTIYSFGANSTKAAWVNGGILYTIDGNAQLSNDQLQKLATSL